MHIAQNIFAKERAMRDITLNSKYIVLFKDPNEQVQTYHLLRQMYHKHAQYMLEAFRDVISVICGHLVIDLTQDTSGKFQLPNGIV